MRLAIRPRSDVGTVSLKSAMLCVDCESVTSTRGDECPVCGSRAVLSLARMLGGSLLTQRAERAATQENTLRFDLDVAIALKQMEAKDLNAVLEVMTSLIGPRLGRGGASFHVSVEPVDVGSCIETFTKAA